MESRVERFLMFCNETTLGTREEIIQPEAPILVEDSPESDADEESNGGETADYSPGLADFDREDIETTLNYDDPDYDPTIETQPELDASKGLCVLGRLRCTAMPCQRRRGNFVRWVCSN